MEATRKPLGPPEDRFVRPEPPAHRTFYREEGVSVTDRWFTIGGRRFAVAELRNLRTAEEQTAPVAVASTAVACLLVAATATFAAFSGDPAMLVGGPFLVALPIGLALVTWRLRRRFFALYAEYGDQTVQVFGTFDQRRYNQICRALVRAREYNREHAY